jgi:hypothetical protein
MATDFKADRIRSNILIASRSDGLNASFNIYSASDASDLSGGITGTNRFANVGLDTFIFVSGAIGSRNNPTTGSILLVGGDLHVSGNLTVDGSSPGGGGGSPGGSNTQVQFNDGGSFGGDSGLVFDSASDSLTAAGNITGSILYATNNVTASYAEFGDGSLATTGSIRLANNSKIVARNAADSADIDLLSLDSSNDLHIGDGTTNPGSLVVDIQSSAVFRIAGTYEFALYPSYLDLVLPSIIFRNTESSPTFKQGDDSSGTGKGQSLTIQAQNMTNGGAAPSGGNLELTAGTGTGSDGSVQIYGSLVGITGSVYASDGAVFNESAGNNDFRVESQNYDHMIFVDASEDQIGFGVSSIGGSDVNIFFSGSQGSKVDPDSGQVGNGQKGTAVFGGDVVISGTLYGGSPLKIGSPIEFQSVTAAQLTGSLTKLNDGTSYLVAGSGMTITSESNGSVSLSSTTEFSPDNDMFSLANLLSGSGGPAMSTAVAFTLGVRFLCIRQRTITGVRFWANYSGDTFVTVKLYNIDGNDVASATTQVTGGSTMHEISFDSVYEMQVDEIGKYFIVGLYNANGDGGSSEYPYSSNFGDMPATPFVADPFYLIQKADIYGSGDNFPEGDASQYYMIDPIFRKITS